MIERPFFQQLSPVPSAVRTRPGRGAAQAADAQRAGKAYPTLGVIGAICGTFLAVSLVPLNPAPRGALFASSLAMAFGLAVAPIWSALNTPLSFLRGDNLLALAPIYWVLLDLLQSSYDMVGVSRSQVQASFMVLGLFSVAVWIGSRLNIFQLPRVMREAVALKLPGRVLTGAVLLAFALGMLKFAIPCGFDPFMMLEYVGAPRFSAPWSRGMLGGWEAIPDHLAYFGFLLPALTVLVVKEYGLWNLRSGIAASFAIIFVCFLLQDSGRRMVGATLGLGLVVWVFQRNRASWGTFVFAVPPIVGILALMQFAVDFRTLGYSNAIKAISRGEQMERRSHLHVDDNFYRLTQMLDLIPEQYPYVKQRYLIYIIVRPIPRVLWPGKPISPGFDLAEAVGAQGTSLSCSAVGELYMSYGLVAVVFGGLLYGLLAGLTDKLLSGDRSSGGYILSGAMLMSLFAGMRSLLDLILIGYVVLAWLALSWGMRKWLLVK